MAGGVVELVSATGAGGAEGCVGVCGEVGLGFGDEGEVGDLDAEVVVVPRVAEGPGQAAAGGGGEGVGDAEALEKVGGTRLGPEGTLVAVDVEEDFFRG